MPVQGERLSDPFSFHKLEADAVHQAEVSPIGPEQPRDSAVVEIHVNPVHVQERDNPIGEVVGRGQSEAVL